MCRICGRMVKCIFDTMPSRTISRPGPSKFITSSSRLIHSGKTRQICSQARIQPAPRAPLSQTEPVYLPIRARTIHITSSRKAELKSTAAQPASTPIPASLLQSFSQPSTVPQTAPETTDTTTTVLPFTTTPPASLPSTQPLVLSKSIQQLLPVLAAQTPHYISAHIHSFPYLLTTGDTLRLPFHLHGVQPGDILRFNRATILGSRDYTLKAAALPQQLAQTQTHFQSTTATEGAMEVGDIKHTRGEFKNGKRSGEPSYIDERLYECRVRVMALDSGPMMVTEKKKRRNRHLKKVMSKHKYTVVKVMEVRVKTLEDVLEQEEGQVVME